MEFTKQFFDCDETRRLSNLAMQYANRSECGLACNQDCTACEKHSLRFRHHTLDGACLATHSAQSSSCARPSAHRPQRCLKETDQGS